MLVVLTGVGAFVYWRVEYALDRRLNADLTAQSSDIQRSLIGRTPAPALAALGDEGRDAQILSASGTVLAEGSDLRDRGALLTGESLTRARTAPLMANVGNQLSGRGRHIRFRALPAPAGATRSVTAGRPAIVVAATRLDQRDEALDELLVQLALANLVALVIASLVGYRLARAALTPVERYRRRADAIAEGATGVRLEVPAKPDDEITRLGRTLNQMLTNLETSAERQRQFIDDASHELRTPLTVLAAEVDIALRRPRSDEQLTDTLRRISTDVALVVDLANDLLTLGADGIDVSRATAISSLDVLETAARRARGLLGTNDHRPVFTDGAGSQLVHADRLLLDRAPGNLADNAVRYGAGGITLDNRQASRGSEAYVVLTVSDEGAGMPAAFLPQAAERFRRADESRHTEGTGLGLALVDAIARAHHGQLRLCSNDTHHSRATTNAKLAGATCAHSAHGTTASIWLPVLPCTSDTTDGNTAENKAHAR